MEKSTLFIIPVFLSVFIFSCDNMDRDDLLNGISVPDNGEIQDIDTVDEEPVTDNSEIVDDYMQPDNTDEVPDEENSEEPVCGNTLVETGESCDLNSAACSSILGDNYEGTANCKDDCSGFDTSSCTEIEQNTDVYYVDQTKCNGCRKCLNACDYGAISMTGFKAVIDPDKCTGCGDCTKYCSRGAIQKK